MEQSPSPHHAITHKLFEPLVPVPTKHSMEESDNDNEVEGIMDNAREQLYKILVIGEYGVGKVRWATSLSEDASCLRANFVLSQAYQTSIIRRYTEGYFSPNYKLTIGVDFALKVIDWDEYTKINLQLWDVAGHERFGHMTRVYYKYAIAAIIVFDVSRPATFEAVSKWYKDISDKVMLTNEKPIPILLLANKCDLDEFAPNEDKLNEYCQENGFSGWFPTSAKDDKNIDQAMKFLVQTILNVSEESPSKPYIHNTFRLNSSFSPALSYASSVASHDSPMDIYYSPPTDESYQQNYDPTKKKKCCS